jgi:coenzyme F420 biosynthesis associated uncharacterized protein
MPAPVDWKRAERVAIRVAMRQPQATSGSIHSADFVDLARIAEDRVEATTGLRSLLGPADVQVIDRADWIRANIASFQTLLDPLLAKWSESSARTPLKTVTAITSRVAAVEVGAMLGWMSARVLGQYDLLVGDASGESEGAVYLVGPNMLALENRFGFPAEEFRLWVTLHELTHRAQFTGVPWMRAHFLDLMHRTLELADPDPAKVMAALRDAARDRDAAKQRLRDGGLVAMVSSPEQQAVFHQIAGLMSLLEGHGDIVMDRAGAELVPSAARFSRVLHERRRRANPVTRLIQRLIGLEGKLNQYAAGERFISEIETVGGERAVDRCWEEPANLPSLDEIRAPELWLERVGVEHTVA